MKTVLLFVLVVGLGLAAFYAVQPDTAARLVFSVFFPLLTLAAFGAARHRQRS